MDLRLAGVFTLSQQLQALAAELPARSAKALHQSAELLVAGLKSQFLSGQYLNVRTGRLRSSPQITLAAPVGDEVIATVSLNPPYAAVHEFGYTGPQNVREHTRRTKAQMAPKYAREAARLKRMTNAGGRAAARAEAKIKGRQAERAAARQRAPGIARERAERRAAGLQGGVAGSASRRLIRRAEKSGRIVVRAHQRYVRFRARHYARDATDRYRREMEERFALALRGGPK